MSSELSSRQQRAIAALLTSKSMSEAATSAGVGERTLYRWLAEDEAFRAGLARAESELLDTATRRLLALQGQAIETLEHLQTGERSGLVQGVQSCIKGFLALILKCAQYIFCAY
jgi:transposase